jgi:adenylate cyclase
LIDIRRIRLASGLVLALFLVTHFGNHALGLISVAAMEAGRTWFVRLWHSWPGTVALYGALAAHFVVALVALYRRPTLRMPLREAAQYIFGLALPLLLVSHVVATRVGHALTGLEARYPEVLYGLWVAAPMIGAKQALALLIAWGHACLGLWFWLRVRPSYRVAAPYLFAFALLVPVLALLGFAQGGEEVAAAGVLRPPLDPAVALQLAQINFALTSGLIGLIVATLAARGLRSWRARSTRVRVSYPQGRIVTVPAGYSVLEASRHGRIPHNSVCGGKGRCSTCRVRITAGLDAVPPPGAAEQHTLARFGAGPDVRLACQLRPTSDLAVTPVLTHAGIRPVLAGGDTGREREIAVLFCDLRGFTRMSESRLPFDTVFLLNRYFQLVGEAVEAEGGHLDKFIGDGALALFGLSEPLEVAAGQAFRAAAAIARGIAELSETLGDELGAPLRIAMSLHAGPAIVGVMGFGESSTLTAIGDTINAASRLEGAAKEFDAELVVSTVVADRAGLDLAGHPRRSIAVRGRAAPIEVWVMERAGGQPAQDGRSTTDVVLPLALPSQRL